MKFLHHLFSHNEPGFDNISGYDDIKDIVIRALDAEENYNLLFIGPPASSKTLFLMGIQEIRKEQGEIRDLFNESFIIDSKETVYQGS